MSVENKDTRDKLTRQDFPYDKPFPQSNAIRRRCLDCTGGSIREIPSEALCMARLSPRLDKFMYAGISHAQALPLSDVS